MSNQHSGASRREKSDRQLYALLHVAEEDLRQASFFAAHILKKGWHFQPSERRWTLYMQQAAFTTAFAIAYARPFTESRGCPKFPGKLLRVFNTSQKQLHRKVLEVRNSVYAHSDQETRKIRPTSFGGNPSAIEAMPEMRFTREELIDLQTMISLVRKAIRDRKSKLIASVAGKA
jgi:hypothetical protein